MSVFERHAGKLSVPVDRAGVLCDLAVSKFDPQPSGDFHVWVQGKSKVSMEPRNKDAKPVCDFRDRLEDKSATIHFYSKPMSTEWGHLHDRLLGLAYAEGDFVEAEIYANGVTVAYIASIVATGGQNRPFILIELEPLRPANQPKSETVKAYAILETKLGWRQGAENGDE